MNFDTNIIVEDLNIDNQVPPEYQNDPDLWYTIQASLKVLKYYLPRIGV